ncbi:MAG TPA: glycosyltransferase family 4 protein, partial [Myxococcota bacterium]|nr:glycosyltransferase family 4 protein [Myxococcota bacterium]
DVDLRRLVIYSRRFPPDALGGAETVIAALAREAERRLDEVSLVAGWSRERGLLPSGAVPVDLSGGPSLLGRWRAVRAVARVVRERRPDAVLSNHVEVHAAGVPTVLICHDFAFGRRASEADRPADRLRLLAWRLARLRADAVVAVSEATRERLLELGWSPDRVAVIRAGVDTSRFTPGPASLDHIGPARLLCVSRLVPEKGIELAIEAVRELAPRRRVELVIVGAAPDPAWLARVRIAAAGLPVHFETDVDDTASWYRGCDVVLFPTLVREGLGLVALEAMSAGRPVVHSDDPAVMEATAGLGLAFPRGDVRALVARIEQLLDEPRRAQDLGERGRDLCLERYDWRVAFEAYRGVIEAALGRRVGGRVMLPRRSP